MENASGDLRRALGRPILGRQMLEVTNHAVEEFAELDAHNSAWTASRAAESFLAARSSGLPVLITGAVTSSGLLVFFGDSDLPSGYEKTMPHVSDLLF